LKLGALLIATGTGAYPMLPSGEICVAQRMIAAVQKAGVSTIAVVTGPDDKKMEKHLAQHGVFFLQNPQPEQAQASVQMGLAYLAEKCDRLFLMQTNYPLIDPDTLLELAKSQSALAVPTYHGSRGQPLLLCKPFPEALPIDALIALPQLQELPVEDPGILLTAEEAVHQSQWIAAHEQKLTRLMPDYAITRGKNLVDRKLIVLLRLIQQTQSVRDACTRMQISYSLAWNTLNGAEDSLGYPLLLRNKGGPSGAGSLLTEKGLQLLTACDRFESAAQETLEKLYDQYLRDIV